MAACLAARNRAIHSHRDVFTPDGNHETSSSVRASGTDSSVHSQTGSMSIPTCASGSRAARATTIPSVWAIETAGRSFSLRSRQVAESRSTAVLDDRQIGRVTRRISRREPEAARGLLGRDPAPEPMGALGLRAAQGEAVGLFLRAKLDLLQDIPPHRPGHVAWRSEPDGDDIAAAPRRGSAIPHRSRSCRAIGRRRDTARASGIASLPSR